MRVTLFIAPLFVIAMLGLTNNAVWADDSLAQESSNPQQFDKLGFKGSDEPTRAMSQEETTQLTQQAMNNFSKQVEMSDPETQAAILKAQRKLQMQKAKEESTGSN